MAEKFFHIENLRKIHEFIYRKTYSSAEVVAEHGHVDYDNCATIKAYQERGYELIDSVLFGVNLSYADPSLWGEFLVFVKKEQVEDDKAIKEKGRGRD